MDIEEFKKISFKASYYGIYLNMLINGVPESIILFIREIEVKVKMDKYVEEFSEDLRKLNLSELEIIDVIIEDLKKYLKTLSEKRTSMIAKNLNTLYTCRDVK